MTTDRARSEVLFHGASNRSIPLATRAEVRIIGRIFQQFDADHSGTIDIDELENVMKAMGHMLTREQLHELLEQVDVDSSGAIDFNEFIQLISLWKEASQFKLFDASAPSIQAQRIQTALFTSRFLSDSGWHFAWDLLISAVTLYFWITFLFLETQSETLRNDLKRTYFLPFDCVFSLIYLLDIGVTCNTALTLPDGTLLEDVREITIRYLRTPFFYIDVLSCIPFNQFGPSVGLRVMSYIRLGRVLRLPYLFEPSHRCQMTPRYVLFYYYVLPIVRGVQYFIFFVHLLAVVWTQVATPKLRPSGSSSDDGWKVREYNDVSYTAGIYFVMSTITTCGFGDVAIRGDWERIFAMLLCLCGTLLNGLVIGSIVSIIQKTDIQSERANQLRQTLAVCQFFSIPESLQDEILQFQNHVLQNNMSEAYKALVKGLPPEMKANIGLYVRIRLITSVPIFACAHQGTKVALAQALLGIVYRPEEYIVIAGESAHSMFVISYGFVDVISPHGLLVKTLQQGDYFGEMALLTTHNKRSASVKALCYCDLYKMDRPAFSDILARFPRFRKDITDEANRRRSETLGADGQQPSSASNPLQSQPTASAAAAAVNDELEDTISDGGSAAQIFDRCFLCLADLEKTTNIKLIQEGCFFESKIQKYIDA